MFTSLLIASSFLLSNAHDTVPGYIERSIIISTSKVLVYKGKGMLRIDFTADQNVSSEQFIITLNLTPIVVVYSGPLKKGERFIMNLNVRKFLEDRTLKADTIRPVIKYVSTVN